MEKSKIPYWKYTIVRPAVGGQPFGIIEIYRVGVEQDWSRATRTTYGLELIRPSNDPSELDTGVTDWMVIPWAQVESITRLRVGNPT